MKKYFKIKLPTLSLKKYFCSWNVWTNVFVLWKLQQANMKLLFQCLSVSDEMISSWFQLLPLMKVSEFGVGFFFFWRKGWRGLEVSEISYLWEESIMFKTPGVFCLFVWKEMTFWVSKDRHWSSSHLIKSITPYFFQKIIKFILSQKVNFIHFPTSTSHSSMKMISFSPRILRTQISITDVACWWMLPSYLNASLLF